MSCAQLLAEIRSKGITEFALTDHDRLGGMTEMTALLPDGSGLIFHSGVELSVSLSGQEYHLTAYDFDIDNAGVLNLLEDNRAIRRKFDVEFVRDLAARFDIDVDEFVEYRFDRSRGGWESLNFLIDKAIVADAAEYARLRSGGRIRMEFDGPRRAVAAVHAANGYICLAHPGGYREHSIVTRDQLDLWEKLGIDGIECHASSKDVTERQRGLYLSYCHEKGLYITGGSDYHGSFVSRKLGVPPITRDMLRLWPQPFTAPDPLDRP